MSLEAWIDVSKGQNLELDTRILRWILLDKLPIAVDSVLIVHSFVLFHDTTLTIFPYVQLTLRHAMRLDQTQASVRTRAPEPRLQPRPRGFLLLLGAARSSTAATASPT